MAGVGNATLYDIGIRRNIAGLGERNFDKSAALAGTVVYASKFSGISSAGIGLWWVDGNLYSSGQSLPYDVGGISYSVTATALLEFYWNQQFIVPTT